MKCCIKCNIPKDLSKFSRNKGTKDGFLSVCKECHKNYMVSYYVENKETINNSAKDFYKNNIEMVRKRIKKYDLDNKEKLNFYKKELSKKKYKNDNLFKLVATVRNRIGIALKDQKSTSKTKKSLVYLGCNEKEYKIFIEQQFKPEMTWKNHGLIWEIDHIIPISSFDLSLEENIYKAFNYKNTQPIFKTTKIAESFGYEGYLGNRDKGKLVNG
jgi:hypothetical protein